MDERFCPARPPFQCQALVSGHSSQVSSVKKQKTVIDGEQADNSSPLEVL